MSKTIDERVVEMRFDNKQFESNVQTSLSTIEKLKKSLDMDGATKGLESIDSAAKKVDMSGLGSAVETVKTRFSALEVMAVTALANITNSVVNTGKQMLRSLTIEPIADGFNEYELTLNAIQTTMAGTGKTAKEVETQLKKLDEYADKTVYSSADMFNNLPKFTNAGVEIEQATTAMVGIANATALAGGDARQASIAFYNLGQAIGTGYLSRMDYNSINNAGIATMEWKNQMVEAALAAGTLTEAGDGLYKAGNKTFTLQQLFIDGLQEQWATTDVMMKVFQDYGDETTEIGAKAYSAAQDLRTFSMMMDSLKATAGTGWKDTWQILFGDLDEAKELWTELGNVIGGFISAQADARNEMLQGWKDLGGRTKLIEALKNAFEGVQSVIKPIYEAFREIFPPTTAKQLYDITENLRKFTANLKLSDTASVNLKSTFKGLFAILDIVKQAFSAIFTAIKPLFGGLGTLGDGILGFTGGVGDAIVAFDEFIKTSGAFQKVGEGIATVIQIIMTALSTLKNKIKEKFESANFEVFHSLLERIHERMAQVGEAAGEMKSGVIVAFEVIGETLANCQFVQLLSAVWNAVKTIGSGIVKILGELGSSLAKNLGEANFSGIIDLLNGISFGAIAVGITKFVGTFRKAIEDIGSFKESFIGILDSVRGCFEAYQNQLQAGTLLKIASAIAILTASLIALSLVDSEKLNVALGAITVLFADLLASMAVFNKISGQVTGVVKSVTAMLGIATAVLILASALKKIADLDAKQLTTGLIGVAGLTTMMVAAAKAMSSNSKAIIKGATQMVIFAAAIKILASVCEQLAKLDWNQLAKGLVGVGVLLAEVSLFLRTAKFSGKSITTATGIVILSAAIKVLASACKDFGEMKWEDIGKGLASIAVLLAEITAFTKLTGNAQNVISTGVALIAIAAAMKILASAVKDFSTMQWDEIARGLTAMAGALAAITVAVKFMPNNMAGIGAGLVIVAAALVVLSTALEKMGNLSWEQVAKGLITLGGAMAILAIGLNAMTGTLAGSAALLVAASALLVLTPVLTILGAMSWSSIVKGLVTLAGAFAILGVAGAVLTPLVPSILALSGSLALIGVAVVGIGAGLALAGAGLSALAVGLTALAAAGTAGATAIVASLTVIITGVAGLIPAIVAKIGEAIVEFCKVIADSAGAIGEAVKAVILMLVDVLVECVPAIADGALKLIAGVLEALVEYTPSIVDSIFQFLIAVLEGVAKNLPSLIQAAVDVLMAFFSGIVDALKGIDTETLLQGIVGIGLLAAIMAALSAVAALVPGAMLGVLGMGAVIAELALVLAAVGALAQIPGLNWLINEGGNLLQGIGTAIGKFVGGIVGGFMSGVSSQFPQIGSDLSGFMTNVQPFLDGAASIDPAMLDGVKALAETILILTAANILDGLTSWFTGGSSLSGFAEEMVPFGKAMKQFSDEISGIDGEAVSNAAIAGKTLAEMADTLPNTGGVVGFFAGENDMNAFGEQLIPFGRAMRNFANEVAGIDASVITEAATAGKALAEMASTVPNSGGVVGFFAGENDMDDFGEQLVPFGRAMKDFSDAVSGLKADVIQNSVTAGQALLELANTVPNTGGVVSWFTGDNDLETFGEQLVPFGTAMKNYSLAVTGLDASVVTNSANAAKALVELSNNLPNSGGIVSWFTGDNDIASFGEQLVSFGQSFAAYYNSVSGVDVAKLSGVVVEFRNLVDLANGIKSVDTSGMSTFAQNLTNLGNAGIDGFINAFTNANSRVSTAANTMVTTFINAAKAQQGNLTSTFTTMINGIVTAFTSKYSQFTVMGQTMMTNFISGIRTGDASARSAFVTIVSGCLTAIRNKFYEFNTVGQTTMTNLIAGIRAKNQLAKDAFVQIINSCLTAIRNKYTDFYNAGKYLVEGFAAGITANTYMAEARARAMARAAAAAAEAELDINSPSKVGYRIGGFFGMGFVNSLIDYADKSYDAGASVAKSAKEGLRNAVSKIGDFIENGIDSQPTIRPLLDLSDVTEGAGRLSALLSRNQAMKISAGMEREGGSVVQNGGTTPTSGNNYNFTQNNYSPKALSRIDIYRQTKNQFSALKGLVET
nr:MAG TPA: tail tape measure [Caudoviricetes sp.]